MTVRISYREYKNEPDFAFQAVSGTYDKEAKTIEILSSFADIVAAYLRVHFKAEDLGKLVPALASKEFSIEDCRAAARKQKGSENKRLATMAAQLQKCLDKYDELRA